MEVMEATSSLPLSLDWLSLSLVLHRPLTHCPEYYRWAYYSPTNVWNSRWVLYNGYGDKVFTILFQPRSRIIAADRAVLEIANEWLYRGYGVKGVLGILSQCFDTHDNGVGFTITGINRVDLAVDFTPTDAQHDVIVGLNNTSLRVAGKQNGSGFWSTVKSPRLNEMWAGYCPHDMNWGHKTSDVKWKLYYKSKELQDEAGGQGWSKPYIVDMWREVGLDESNVWRLEVSVRNCNNFDFMGEKLTFYRLMKSGSDLFQALYTSRFTIQRNQGHKDRSNDEIVQFLDVGTLRGAFKVHREKHLVEHNSVLTLLRHLINDAMTEQVVIGDIAREALIGSITQVVDGYGLHPYFQEVTGMNLDTWVEWLRVRGYYFGEEHLPSVNDDGTKMEDALLTAGVIQPHFDERLNPLGAPSSKSQVNNEGRQLGLRLP